MLAAVYRGNRDVRVETWPAPPPPPTGWVTVAVRMCGICGTDLEEYLHGPSVIPVTPHPLTGASLPLVLGHEAAGTVVAAGPGAGIDVGTRVGLENSVACGHCEYCRSGTPALCDVAAVMGLMIDGALAERVNVPAAMCAPLPAGLGFAAAAMAEPLSVAVRAVRRSQLIGGAHLQTADVQVHGAGAIGILTAQVALATGARSVTILDPSAARRAVAADCGLIAAAPGEAPERAEVVFECSGSEAGLTAALAGTGKGGVTMMVGIHAVPRTIDLLALLLEERSLVASVSHAMQDDYVPAVALLASGKVIYEPLISAVVPLERAVSGGLDALVSNPDANLKVLVECSA